MANLLSQFGVAGNALGVLQEALSVLQNNVSNASTPGYAAQQLNIQAQPSDSFSGGGIVSQGLISSRDAYADTAVQQTLQSLGFYTAQAQGTSSIQSLFDPSGTSGVAGALTSLYGAFSAWSASPGDPATGQAVITQAKAFAGSVQGLSRSLNSVGSQLNQQISSTVSQINTLASRIQQYNEIKRANPTPNPGADANLEATLESLSQLTNLTTVSQLDGTVTVLVGGGAPLVIGSEQYRISASIGVSTHPPATNPQSPPTAQILSSDGKDITAELIGGQLGGLLDSRDRVLASIIGDSQQAGTLNQFAQGVATKVNTILQAGTVSNAVGAAPGSALFTYSSVDATQAAGSLAVSATILPGQLAPADAVGSSNGNALTLVSLASPGSAPTQINGQSFLSFFAGIASSAGQENSSANANQTLQQQIATQAQAQRDQISKVSLNDQAALLLQFQRGYQAISELLSVVNSLVNSILSIIPQQ